MKKITNAEKLSLRQEHSPNAILYRFLMWVIKILNRSVNTSFIYKARPSDEKGPIVLVSNLYQPQKVDKENFALSGQKPILTFCKY